MEFITFETQFLVLLKSAGCNTRTELRNITHETASNTTRFSKDIHYDASHAYMCVQMRRLKAPHAHSRDATGRTMLTIRTNSNMLYNLFKYNMVCLLCVRVCSEPLFGGLNFHHMGREWVARGRNGANSSLE